MDDIVGIVNGYIGRSIRRSIAGTGRSINHGVELDK